MPCMHARAPLNASVLPFQRVHTSSQLKSHPPHTATPNALLPSHRAHTSHAGRNQPCSLSPYFVSLRLTAGPSNPLHSFLALYSLPAPLACRCCHAHAHLFGWVSQGEEQLPAEHRRGLQGSQAQYVRVPLAASTLMKVKGTCRMLYSAGY